MIDFAAKVLVKTLQEISSRDIMDEKARYNAIPVRMLQNIWFHSEGDLDETALARKLDYLNEWVALQLDETGWEPDEKDGMGSLYGEPFPGQSIGIFDLVHCLVSKLITVSRGRIVYRYKYLKTWHYLTGKVGSNLFVGSVLAKKDYKDGFRRREFSNTDVLHHDNQILNEVFDKGMSENHFHLRCSSPYFLLSWISLMNNVTVARTARLLDQIDEEPRSPRIQYQHNSNEDRFCILHLKAAAIRAYLYACLTGQMIEFGEYQVSVEWLLDHILDTEFNYKEKLVDKLCGSWPGAKTTFHENDEKASGTTIMQYIEGCIGDGQMGELESCKGFWWFFVKCFPDIPVEILSPDSPLFSRKNRHIIAEYISGNYEPLALCRCAWLFQGKNSEKYNDEWMNKTRDALSHLLRDLQDTGLETPRQQIQQVIESFHACSPRECKDYALSCVDAWKKEDWNQAVFWGERWLSYEMERRRFSRKKGDFDEHLYNLFFMYLAIKEKFRSELLQNNDKIGFRNFQIYQSRKNWFTTIFTEAELAKIAVEGAFQSQKLEKLELRVMPKESGAQNIQMINMYDKAIGKIPRDCGKKEPDYYYVFHFRKEKDRIYEDGQLRCRHEVFRHKLEQQAGAIISMRVNNPETGMRLKGIDACASEDGCRPEVFAAVFRRLKQHTVYRSDKNSRLPQLRVSYHVGEENQDVLDGLRAIDEAIYFLNLGSGDRLGHATMLGINAGEWYQKQGHIISIRQQDYLDNVVWLYHRMIHYHVSNNDNLLEYLEREFQVFFNRIYERNMSPSYNTGILNEDTADTERLYTLQFNIHNYYNAWELRGDDPHLYADGYYNSRMLLDIQSDDQRANPLLKPEKRRIAEAAVLYHAYHYNPAVCKEGNKPVVIKIPGHMVYGISLLQKAMQKDIAKKGIAIETNPSSNLMIGGLAGYDSHPIVSFNNKGLVSDSSMLNDCPQINVSINTDDLGVFTTTLYNEYTLMAYALENKLDHTGANVYKKDMVYDWINHVREMGNEQSFSRELMMGDGKIKDLPGLEYEISGEEGNGD